MPASCISFVHHAISCLGWHLFNLELDLPLSLSIQFLALLFCEKYMFLSMILLLWDWNTMVYVLYCFSFQQATKHRLILFYRAVVTSQPNDHINLQIKQRTVVVIKYKTGSFQNMMEQAMEYYMMFNLMWFRVRWKTRRTR
jgi:hypothetical protein